MLEATGSCNGIENYSRYLTGRKPGEPPPTLFEYIPDNAIVFADESHVSVPQIGGMYRGDYRRKFTLAEHGFRLPSCMDNRPLKFEEWDAMRPQSVFVSATPAAWEIEQTGGVFTEQVIRPTGLIDPPVEIRPVSMQVDDLLDEVRKVAAAGNRALVTVLTKRMAEDLTEYLHEQGIRVRYMHSDIETLERIEILRDLRLGAFDVLVGINLLREGLDIPECALVAILDADKEGFLRSETSLVQTIGRAARNVDGRVIMYADRITGSMERAIAETNRRREKQTRLQRAARHHPGDRAQERRATCSTASGRGDTDQARITARVEKPMVGANLAAHLDGLRKAMLKAAENLEFEEAARLRDEIKRLEAVELAVADDPLARQSAVEAEVEAAVAALEGRPGRHARLSGQEPEELAVSDQPRSCARMDRRINMFPSSCGPLPLEPAALTPRTPTPSRRSAGAGSSSLMSAICLSVSLRVILGGMVRSGVRHIHTSYHGLRAAKSQQADGRQTRTSEVEEIRDEPLALLPVRLASPPGSPPRPRRSGSAPAR